MFGTKMRYLRKKIKLSQQKLGEEINIPQTTISDWENNKYLPNINEAVKLAAALGVSVAELIEQPKDTKTA